MVVPKNIQRQPKYGPRRLLTLDRILSCMPSGVFKFTHSKEVVFCNCAAQL